MKRRGTSIRIYLADGTPDGLRIVERSNWTGRALMVSKSQYLEIRQRDELRRPGVYVLRGQAERRGLGTRVYIGEADTARTRLDSHVRTKDFWDDLILFTSKDDTLNKAHIRYLESRLIRLAIDAKRVELENNTSPQLPALSEPERDDAEGFLENMLLIYPVLGVTAFDPNTSDEPDEEIRRPLLLLSGKGAEGKGRDLSEGFTVYAGARARRSAAKSAHPYVLDLRDALLEKGVFEDDGEHLVLKSDYRFKSPSTAASTFLGRSANGRIEWKDETGRTLREIQEQALTDVPDSDTEGTPTA